MDTKADRSITLRPATAEDQEFLAQVYASTRMEEVSAWGLQGAQADAFLKMQFTARQRSYEMIYPKAECRIVMKNEEAIGQMIVDRGSAKITLVDIAFLPQFRNAGIGTQLLRELIEEGRAHNLPLRLKVLKSNVSAARLYERLRFARLGEDEMYCEMSREPE